MPYDAALSKAWREIGILSQEKSHTVSFLAENYSVDPKKKRVLPFSCSAPAKDYLIIIILHYLIRRLQVALPALDGEWISFQQLPGGLGYYPTFKKRVVERILRKYGANPDGLLDLVGRFKAKRTQLADISIILEAFEGAPLLITFWRADAEFGPELKIHFDKSIVGIFCTEDIVVLSEIIASQI